MNRRDQIKRWEQTILDEVTILDTEALFFISVDFDPEEPYSEERFFYRIRGTQRGKPRVVKTRCRGTAQELTDALPKIKAAAESFQTEKLNSPLGPRGRPLTSIQIALDQIGKNTPHAFWQPVMSPVHAPKDNETLRKIEHDLRQNLKYFDPCKPIELVRDGIHYSAKKALPPHLFVRGKGIDDPEATNHCWDPISRMVITHIDDYEAAYAIVEEVLAEFRRVGLVKALCVGLDCTFKGIL